jgi:glycosyltransferase involved in cell wall biosynthesis
MMNISRVFVRRAMPAQKRGNGGAPAVQRRVLFIDHTAKLGGGEISLIHLVSNMNANYRPVVLLFSEGPLVSHLLNAGIETHVLHLDPSVGDVRKDSLGLGSLLRIFSLMRICLFILELRRFIKRLDIVIVHTNSLKSDLIGGIAARSARLPVVWHLRDRISDDYLPATVAKVIRILARIIPRRVVANSFATLKTLRLKSYRNAHGAGPGLAPAPRFQVVYDGVARTAIVRDAAENPRPTLTVGMVGRIAPWKGQHIFLEAATIVRRKFPQARFQIIGGALFNESEYEREIRELATLRDLGDIVEFTGHRNDVASLVAGMDLLVHASITGEPFGQVIIEGMAAGKPVVATNGGGVPEIILHGVTGLLVPMGDVDAMARAIERFLEDREFREKAGRLGQQRVLSHFSIDRTVRRVEEIYDGLLESSAAEQNPGPDLQSAPL